METKLKDLIFMEDNNFPKKILIINTFYYIEGGADTYAFQLVDLLKKEGHDVIFFCMQHPRNNPTSFEKYFVSNVDFQNRMNFWQKLKSIPRLFWSREANRKLRQLIENEKPHIAHIHNIHYEISPSIIYTLKRHNIPIVMTLHDYVLVCPLRTMYVNNEVCDSCKGGNFFSAVRKKCIRGSYLASFIVYLSFIFHKALKTFSHIDLFVSPSRFLADTFQRMGFRSSIVTKPYCFDSAGDYNDSSMQQQGILYFGRLQAIKGLDVLIEAVRGLDVNLRIVGRGPVEERLHAKLATENIRNVTIVGHMSQAQLKEELRRCLFVVQPSLWYENYPYSIIESFACGRAVIGSNRGGIPELVIDKQNGLLFDPVDPNDLRNKIQFLLHNRHLNHEWGLNAQCWVKKTTDIEDHYRTIIGFYQDAARAHQVSFQ